MSEQEEGSGAGRVPELSGVDLARQALAAAKEAARARGAVAGDRSRARQGGLRSGARADGRDPMRLGAALERMRTEHGWEQPMAVAGVMQRWDEIVGPDVAAHCRPESYDADPEKRELTVRCDSSAWMVQLRHLTPQLIARLNGQLGQGTVRFIKVLPPGGAPRRYGPLRAPGSTGPGDTYG
ncbi:DUF721 domain-containing protein [Streptomyces bambusae]|uniref:DUF721 domain-containing protein n=1 Tax=Streptomyces bambusae TaxID=1550616 RepID=UPI001CFE190A|nr:DUF721 domain-containing protein [Streptomyces bambusae]MCB5163336.1 DUF721 domain-containing protein [Streptomyces bambusae]